MLNALNDFHIQGVETSIPLYKTILKTEEYKRGDLSTDFLKRYGILDRLTEDIKSDKEANKHTAIAAAIIHSEYFKSRVKNATASSQSWKNKL
jgi:acetyl-CoA/propionyl-CoA carboxylase